MSDAKEGELSTYRQLRNRVRWQEHAGLIVSAVNRNLEKDETVVTF
jgi:hypothetical protein